MKKALAVLLSLLLIFALAPEIFASSDMLPYMKPCSVPDTVYNEEIPVCDVYYDNDAKQPFFYSVPDGGAVIIIFFNNKYGNPASPLIEIAQTNLLQNEKIKFIAAETGTGNSEESRSEKIRCRL